MKTIIKGISFALITLFALSQTGCNKNSDPGVPPDIAFVTSSGFTSADATIAQSTAFKVGINAARTETNDYLKSFNVSASFNGGSSTSLYNYILTTSEHDNFSYTYNGTTRNVTGTEKYIFTITNRDGIVNSISLTITVP